MISTTLATVALIINELMASNVGTAMSPATNFDSWIEVYNPTEETIDLGGMYLSDQKDNLTLWKMPKNMGTVPAKGFKVIWLGSNNIRQDQAPFKLDCDGGAIFISNAQGELMTSMQYPEAMSRTSYARMEDGTGEWGWTAEPTPGATNATSVFASKRLEPPVVDTDSRIFTNSLSVNVAIPEGATLIYTTDGKLPMPPKGNSSETDWTNFIVNGDCEGDDVTCLVGKDGDSDGKLETHILEGVGYDGSRGIKVHAVADPAQAWDTQFFVYTPDHVWEVGEQFRFKIKVRADRKAHVSVQVHSTPGNYITWQVLDNTYEITTEWMEINYEGTVTAEQSGFNGAMQTIAFNLNEERGADNNFYFDDISWESFNGSVIQESQVSKDGKFTISNTTNYCFRLVKEGYLPSVPVTRSYIKTSDKYTVPVVSIVGDRRYFTDPQWGIDTRGTNGKTGNGQETPANWNMDWERPVNFSFITPEGVMAINQDVEISVSGGWTRSANPRSFKLKSGKEFDGQNHLDYQFFPQKPYLRNQVILLRNGGNDVWENNGSRFLDPALQTIIQRSGINIDLQSYVPVMEYVNGELRGVLNMREPNNKKFVSANYGYDDDFIDMFEMDADSNVVFMVGNSATLERIYELGEQAPDMNAYEELKQILDIDEFINYMAVELFLGSSDWPHNNIKGFRNQDNGRYRFVLFDLDFSFRNSNPFQAFADDQWHTFNYIYDLQESRREEIKLVTFFLNMLRNDEFRKQFIDTYCLIGGSVFDKERSTAIVDELADFVRPMMQLDGRRSPDGSANLIKDKLSSLNELMMNCMKKFDRMKLSDVRKQSVVLSTDTEGAHLYVNGLDVPYADFKGSLFQPVKLEAKAPAGYAFEGWRRGASATNLLMAYNSTWKYYDKGAQNGTNWSSTSFDDSSWASGMAPLGYKMSGVKTTVSYGSNANQKNPTTYFRQKISLRSAPKSDDIFLLDYQVDDGFVVYVNGREAGRVNMPSGNVNFNTYSSTYAGDDPLKGTITLPASLFRSGENVIAVEVHNTSATSSDLYWAAQLLTSVDAAGNGWLSTDAIIDLPNDVSVNLVACFTPLPQEERSAQGFTPVRINEVSAANGIYVNEYFKRNDWVELYNTTDKAVDVEGMYLSDNPDKPQKYQITKGDSKASTMIPAHGYLIIWCDKLEPVSQLHASFKLAAEGGEVLLSAADNSWTDRLVYTSLKEDETAGRYPDGTNNVYVMNVPTIAKTNLTTSYQVDVEQPGTNGVLEILAKNMGDLSARYAAGKLAIRSQSEEQVSVRIFNLAGQPVGQMAATLRGGYAEVAVGQLPAGCYIARVSGAHGHHATCKFVKK